jgi:type I restriction-modification system DNA methylase subunit
LEYINKGGSVKIAPEIVELLESCEIDINTVYLPQVQLDRKTYLTVNKCLESIGGKWNRKAKGHVFEDNPAKLLDNLIVTGETTDAKKEFQFFETPPGLAKELVEMTNIKKGDRVLEPSAGAGAILDCFVNRPLSANTDFILHVVELYDKNVNTLIKKSYRPIQMDFLELTDREYDKIIMNPPFTRQQDIDHILHAFSLLANHGILVSIVSESPFFRTNKKSVGFREFLDNVNAEVIKNDDGAFKKAGTMISTRTIKITK